MQGKFKKKAGFGENTPRKVLRNVCQPKAEPASVSFWESAELRVSRTPRSDFWESANSESAERSQQSQLDLIQVWYGIVNFLPVNKFD